jgi:hypothetical protein
MGFSFRRKDGESHAQSDEPEVTVVSSGTDNHALEHADLHIRRLKDQHRFDPFLQEEKIDAIDAAIETGNAEKETAVEASLIGENSPYAEVRAAVSLCPAATPPCLVCVCIPRANRESIGAKH